VKAGEMLEPKRTKFYFHVDEPELTEKAKEAALDLVKSPDFFRRFLEYVKLAGLVGEERNALALYVAGTSRLRPRPINLIVKGTSSAGKEFVVTKVLEFFPPRCIKDPTLLSAHNMAFAIPEHFEHSILHFFEIDGAHVRVARPNRLVAAEGRLVPVACISTTEDALEIDEENRHLSLWIDESPEQTKRIAKAYVTYERGTFTQEMDLVWTAVQLLLEKRKDMPIRTEGWFENLVDLIPSADVRIRRYWPAFVEACKTVSLIRSFRITDANLLKQDGVSVNFEDFAIANLIFDRVIAESLTRAAGEQEVSTADLIAQIAETQAHDLRDRGIEARKLVGATGIASMDKAYRLIRDAESAGTVYRVNPSAKNNEKFYLPMAHRGFIGSPESVFKRLKLKVRGQFIHPLTGETVRYRDSEK
jgi:hypothetical protein